MRGKQSKNSFIKTLRVPYTEVSSSEEYEERLDSIDSLDREMMIYETMSGTSSDRAEKKMKLREQIIEQRIFIETLRIKSVAPPSMEFIPDFKTCI